MVKINLVGFKQFQDTFKQLPRKLQEEIGAEIQFAAEDFRDRAINDAPADVGFLRSQITVKRHSELTFDVVSGSKYSAPMEFGTKGKYRSQPGINASEFQGQPSGGTWLQLVTNLAKWVRRKGISGVFSVKTHRRVGSSIDRLAEDYQLAYVIARSIYKHGVTPHPFFFKQIAPVRRDLFRNIRNILNSVTK